MRTIHYQIKGGLTFSIDKDRMSGKVTAVWPGSSIHYMELVEQPRWEDFEIEYTNDNPFMFLGDGRSQREFQKMDVTYYLD
jgi:hypothetical protein